jgi:hypothetical protein
VSSAAVDVRDRVAARGLALDGAETFTSAGNGSGTFLDSSSSDSSDGRSSSSSCSTGGMLTRVTRGLLVPASCAGAAVYGAKLKIVMVGVSSILARRDEEERVCGFTFTARAAGCGASVRDVYDDVTTSRRLIDERKRWYARGATRRRCETRNSAFASSKAVTVSTQLVHSSCQELSDLMNCQL